MAIRITELNPDTGACEAHDTETGERVCRLSKVVGRAGLWVTDVTGRATFETAQEAAVAAVAHLDRGTERELVWQVGPYNFTRGELREAFDLVADAQNWKAPVDRVVVPGLGTIERLRVDAACRFFAGCGATFTEVENGTRVTAPGYYAAVGA